MTENARLESLLRMVQARPDDARARFGLAVEYEKLGRWEDVVANLRTYLAKTDDEGNAYGRLARAFHELGNEEQARAAYQQGIEAANRHGHPTLAVELEEELEEL
ncbi:MAG: tetratricopeptide repeat protein [Gemmatimonadota bacterium]